MNITSRILQFIPKDLMMELNSIALDVLIPDNNTKIDKMFEALNRYDIDYEEIASGTNRVAVLIDGYVFKIAMDKAGIRDNWAELSLTQELQPFVIKVYECNGLINVSEYVTVISKTEFQSSKEEMQGILSHLAQGYLLGDVGTVNKNFMNWGYRNDGQLVILDFAYIYRVVGDEMMCQGLNDDGTVCEEFLEYDSNFHNLICPKCRKTYTFHDIRRRIDRDFEQKELDMIKQTSYKVTKPNTEVDSVKKPVEPINNETENNNDKGEITNMSKKHKKVSIEIDAMDSYEEALAFAANMYKDNSCSCDDNDELPEEDYEDTYEDESDEVDETSENTSTDDIPYRDHVADYTDELDDEIPYRNTVDTQSNDEEIPYRDQVSGYSDELDDDYLTFDNDSEESNESEEVEVETGCDVPSTDVELPDDNNDKLYEELEEELEETSDIEDVTEELEEELEEVDDSEDITVEEGCDVPETEEPEEDIEEVEESEDITVEEGCDVPETDDYTIPDDDTEDDNPFAGDENSSEGFKIVGVGESFPEHIVDEQPSYDGEMIVFSDSPAKVDDMRNELMEGLEDETESSDEYDEYDDMYDSMVRDQQSLKSSKRNKKNMY